MLSLTVLLSLLTSPLNLFAEETGECAAGTGASYGSRRVALTMPLALTAHDFITKVYGILDPRCSAEEAAASAQSILSIVPESDDYGLWLNPACGYSVSYFGMTPDVEATARFADGRVSDFGYFFLFPYDCGGRAEANRQQSEFCGSLLQELHDMGLDISRTHDGDAIFEVITDYAGNYVDIRLVEEYMAPDGVNTADALSAAIAASAPDASGRFVLILSVEPDAFTEADNLAAL